MDQNDASESSLDFVFAQLFTAAIDLSLSPPLTHPKKCCSVHLPSFYFIQSQCSNLLLDANYTAGFQRNALRDAVHRDHLKLLTLYATTVIQSCHSIVISFLASRMMDDLLKDRCRFAEWQRARTLRNRRSRKRQSRSQIYERYDCTTDHWSFITSDQRNIS